MRLLKGRLSKQKAAAVIIPPEELNGNGKDDDQLTLLR